MFTPKFFLENFECVVKAEEAVYEDEIIDWSEPPSLTKKPKVLEVKRTHLIKLWTYGVLDYDKLIERVKVESMDEEQLHGTYHTVLYVYPE